MPESKGIAIVTGASAGESGYDRSAGLRDAWTQH